MIGLLEAAAMTRKEWRDQVEHLLPALCAKHGFSIRWTAPDSPAAEIEKDGQALHVAPNGIWFLGTRHKNTDAFILHLLSSVSVLRLKACELGPLEHRRQDSRIDVIGCSVPSRREALESLMAALDVIHSAISNLP